MEATINAEHARHAEAFGRRGAAKRRYQAEKLAHVNPH
jgi:hypothetical protein